MDNKKRIQIVTGVITFFILGCVYLWKNDSAPDADVVTEVFSDGESRQKEKQEKNGRPDNPAVSSSGVYIHICGEVKDPGVYTFQKEPRVIDVVQKAGGLTKKAKQDCVNMAQIVADGTQLVIAAKETKNRHAASGSQEPQSDSGRVNINTASKEELMTLSGIGESKARQILSYRESSGKFSKIEDIMNISGIKQGVFNKIKDYITV